MARRLRATSTAAALAVAAVTTLLAGATSPAAARGHTARDTAAARAIAQLAGFSRRTLSGLGNNVDDPRLGMAGTPYPRVAAANYADGVGGMVGGPAPRSISNRIFNDVGQNLFSENGVSEWGWVWGQFVDHDIGLRDETPGEAAPLGFDRADPLESFTNDLGSIDFNRTPAAPGTGVTSPREQITTISSFIDGSNVYGVTPARLDWLRAGRVDGDPTDNAAQLLLPNGFLPRVGARGNRATAPTMDLMGPLMGRPQRARVAGDVRANDNVALTAVQTLMAREHNRIVAQLPPSLPAELRFQLAGRVVGAEIQFVTYRQFLPSVGIVLSRYRGYDPTVDPSLTNEFAVVGYRAHSMVHGEFDVAFKAGDLSAARLAALRRQGVKAVLGDSGPSLTVPLNTSFGNPDLLPQIGIGRLLAALGNEREYRNDEQIDNTMRSVLFEIPKPGTDPSVCSVPVVDPRCFTGVQDLAALDVARGRDHGMPSYNDLRRAYGLAPKDSFTAITGEATSDFPADPKIDPRNPVDDPNILDFVALRDADGKLLQPGTDTAREQAVTGVRRTTVAARLRAIYRTVDSVDAFVGMSAEPHLPGSELGELQAAMWNQQFEALRDGDRFFYANDPLLPLIKRLYGVTYRHTLSDLIALNTGTRVGRDPFHVPAEQPAGPPTAAQPAGLAARPAVAALLWRIDPARPPDDNYRATAQ